jgi:rare lipoprotein A
MHRLLRWLCAALLVTALVWGLGACAGNRELSHRALQGKLPEDEAVGHATWYGDRHHGRTTASGEPFDMHDMTAAHRTLPFGTVVRVIDRKTLKSVVVRINDRGPRKRSLVIDLSKAAARELGILKQGKAPVIVEVLEWGS